MRLDSEQQRKYLLHILESITLQGNRKQIRESLVELDSLVNSINTAVLDIPTPESDNGPPSERN